MAKSREQQAADAYLKFLQSKGAPSGLLYERSRFLDSFVKTLENKDQTRSIFAQALEESLTSLPHGKKSNALSTAREYFPFWMNDVKAIAMFEEYYGFSVEAAQWKPKHGTLKAITDTLDQEIFSDQEQLCLTNYVRALTKFNFEQSVINARSKLVKIILIRLRDAPVYHHTIYRISVDLTLPLFQTKEVKQLYLEVVREFYPFWRNDPKAETIVFGPK